MRNVVFLDIDGVVNTPDCWGRRPHGLALERRLVERLARFVETIEAAVVISSSWRTICPLDEIRTWLGTCGLNPERVIGTTPVVHQPRRWELLAWVRSYEVKENERVAWVAFDDGLDAMVSGHFVLVMGDIGLTDQNITLAQDLFESQWRILKAPTSQNVTIRTA